MILVMETDYTQLLDNLARAGLFFPAVVGVWVFVYALNAWSFQIIVNSGNHQLHLSYGKAYKLTVSGFAFSYISPFGFAGGPYRAMELKPYLGLQRAMSAIILYSMMHILAHICFWATGAIIFAAAYTEKMTPFLWTLFGLFMAVLVVVLFVFNLCYKRGVIVKLFLPLRYMPFIRRWAQPFWKRHADAMQTVDDNVALLHAQPRAFFHAWACEYLARIVNSLELFFILLSLGVELTFADAILVLAFSSLIGNLLFFLPMQLGAREGGLGLIVRILGLTVPGIGVFSSLYSRLREVFWVLVGVGLVKVGNKHLMK